MRPLADMDTIQIEVTNACIYSCSNCTRFCGHYRKPYMMSVEQFKEAVDSLVDFPHMVGVMGGEPLLHPKFEELCGYISSRIPPERTGLWTSLPDGYEDYREVIVRTFGNIFINDHKRDDIYHWHVLVGAEEVCPDRDYMWYLIHHCWLQNSWSASINPNGAWFCEIAGAMSILFDRKATAWKVEKGWWKRTPRDYNEQMDEFCRYCGCAMPLPKRRSVDQIDDISPENLLRIRDTSPKIKKGLYQVYTGGLCMDDTPMAAYKDMNFRQAAARRYGMFLSLNEKGFCTPFLYKNWERSVVNG